jgi:enoyl-CoA hydratase/carnithine racemase
MAGDYSTEKATPAAESSVPVVLSEQRDGVMLLTLNRPERMNGWTPDLEAAYFDLLDAGDADPRVRVFVVTGAGRAFCAGADMGRLQALSSGEQIMTVRPRPKTHPLSIRKPIVAAINGACAGIGLLAALCCDVRIASRQAKFTTALVRRGLIAEHGLSWILPRVVGLADSVELLLSGRVLLGDEAERLRLVHRALPPEEVLPAALEYARDLAVNCAPAAMAAIKWQSYRHVDADLGEALRESEPLMHQGMAGADFKEGVASFSERRAPNFSPLPPA